MSESNVVPMRTLDDLMYNRRYRELQQLPKRELVEIAKRTPSNYGTAYQIGGGSRGTISDLANAVARSEMRNAAR